MTAPTLPRPGVHALARTRRPIAVEFLAALLALVAIVVLDVARPVVDRVTARPAILAVVALGFGLAVQAVAR